jgi:hypothetical protein
MAAFLSRSVDSVVKRVGRRAALNQFWTPGNGTVLDVTTVGTGIDARYPVSDGADLWVPNSSAGTVFRVRASDGKLLETWTGATAAQGALSAIGKIFVTGLAAPGNLYRIDPRQPAGVVTTVASTLGNGPTGLTFDGTRIWTANQGVGGSVSIVTPGASIPWTVTTVTIGLNSPMGALFDGVNVWVTDNQAGTLIKLNPTGAVLMTVTVGAFPEIPVFDGTNIWVPNFGGPSSISVVRAGNGAVLATLTGNGLDNPVEAAFDGERILVTNFNGASVSLWKAADFSTLGGFSTGTSSFPRGACSDGVNFWITFRGNQLARF